MDVQHKQIVCGNTRVFFPFEPYETQKNYMRSVVEALETKKHALLESPTGTGKTLSLLCSSLAWLQAQSGTQSKSIIYYTSRTHMQLSQAAKEMKKTAYGRIPAVVIGSRVQMCLNEEVRSADPNLINRTCRNAIARNACSYYSNYEQKLEAMEQNAVHDIEDLANFGKQHQCCPYYASKKLAETKATIIFMPYNYLLDTSVRKSTQLKIGNSVIIFDEAHNIESALKDSVSGCFNESSLKVVQESCISLPAKVHEALNKEKHGLSRAGYDPKDRPGSIIDEFAKQKPGKQKEKEVRVNPIEELAEKLTNEKLQQVNNFADSLIKEMRQHIEPDKQCSIDLIFQLMAASGIQFSTSTQFITTLDSMASFWSIAGVVNPSFVAKHVSAISNLSHVLSILFPEICTNLESQRNHQKKLSNFYSVYVKGLYHQSSQLAKGPLKDREINFWCLHAAMGLKRVFESTSIEGPRSMIVTSGTLEPMRAIQKELEVSFKIQKSFEHVIGDDQLKILLVSESFKKFSLASDFKGRSRKEYPKELGETLLPMIKILPYGTLIFFASYSAMNSAIKVWQKTSTIWRDMAAVCPVYIEQQNQDQFMSDVTSYKRITSGVTSGNNSKAIFFCVCRGKLSEGINLEGNQCRTVVVVGLPNPNSTDPKVISTKKFHDTRGNKVWYSEQMRRALNQTIGRVIRSRTDFGLLMLIEPKFAEYKYSLSEWTRKYYPVEPVRMGLLEREIKEFFRRHDIEITQSATQNVGAFEISHGNDCGDWSPFSEEDESDCMLTNQPKPISAAEKLASIAAQYRRPDNVLERQPSDTVSEDTRSPVDNNPKRQKTTLDIFNSIYSHSGTSSSNQSAQSSQNNRPSLTAQSRRSVPFNQVNQSSQETLSGRCAPFDPITPSTRGTRTVSTEHPSQSAPASQSIQLNQAVPPSHVTSSNQDVPSDRTAQSSQGLESVHGVLSNLTVQSSQIVDPSQNGQSGQSGRVTQTPSVQSHTTTQATVSTLNYSITRQASDKDRPTTYMCCMCKNEAIRPHSTNCPCDRIGCQNCLARLAGRKCHRCGRMLKKRDFKPRLFKSAFFQHERTPVIVVDTEVAPSARAN